TALASGVGITMHTVNIPVGTTYARFSLFDDFTDGDDDLDMYIFDSNFDFVGSSGSGTSAEEVNLVNPADGDYYVIVHGWQTDGADANYTLFSWALGAVDAGNMTVTAPASATLGNTGLVNVSFSGLSPATKYLGSISYSDGVVSLPVVPTIIRIDTP
ncbi:MAG: pre-peptidase C-terminal domain-containing protein, partial [Chloroflexi bacterium]|nr:pre-peptidase C-terminal domain-containing protein [Chloroflexota bacterium]